MVPLLQEAVVVQLVAGDPPSAVEARPLAEVVAFQAAAPRLALPVADFQTAALLLRAVVRVPVVKLAQADSAVLADRTKVDQGLIHLVLADLAAHLNFGRCFDLFR